MQPQSSHTASPYLWVGLLVLDRYVRIHHEAALCGPQINASASWIKATAQAFARYSKGNAHIIICGRNETAAQETIASFPQNPNAKYEFLECDASRMANVVTACKRLKEERGLTKLNYLFMR